MAAAGAFTQNLGWPLTVFVNGMAVGALARAATRLDDSRLLEAARRAADSVLHDNVDERGMLHRASLDGIASAPAALEDWGLVAGGLFAVAGATGDAAYAVRARALLDA